METENGISGEEPCEQCGLCCRIFGPSISPTPENLYTWMEQGRKDILSWFVAFRQEGPPVNCADLTPADLGDVVFTEMRDRETGNYVAVCPFLKRVAKKRYLCAIHSIKPDMCGNYRPWIWGETAFSRCPALRAQEPGRWPF